MRRSSTGSGRAVVIKPNPGHFGYVKLGSTYELTLSIQNTTARAVRFRVDPFKSSLDAGKAKNSLTYKFGHESGTNIAPGMTIQVIVLLEAALQGKFHQMFGITTADGDQFKIPICAAVAGADEIELRALRLRQQGASALPPTVREVAKARPVAPVDVFHEHVMDVPALRRQADERRSRGAGGGSPSKAWEAGPVTTRREIPTDAEFERHVKLFNDIVVADAKESEREYRILEDDRYQFSPRVSSAWEQDDVGDIPTTPYHYWDAARGELQEHASFGWSIQPKVPIAELIQQDAFDLEALIEKQRRLTEASAVNAAHQLGEGQLGGGRLGQVRLGGGGGARSGGRFGGGRLRPSSAPASRKGHGDARSTRARPASALPSRRNLK